MLNSINNLFIVHSLFSFKKETIKVLSKYTDQAYVAHYITQNIVAFEDMWLSKDRFDQKVNMLLAKCQARLDA